MKAAVFLKKGRVHEKKGWAAREAEERERGRTPWPGLL